MIYKMLLYLKNSGSNQRKTKTAIIDCCLSLIVYEENFDIPGTDDLFVLYY